MMKKLCAVFLFLSVLCVSTASAAVVTLDKAQTVAQNWLTDIVHTYGSWGGSSAPVISGSEPFVYNGTTVGFNFTVSPQGHILVSARDDIPAVKLYSETSTLSSQNKGDQDQISWISKELFQVGQAIDTHGSEAAAADPVQNPDRSLWNMLDKSTEAFNAATATGETATEAVSYGPLLTSTWAQRNPYNQQCPLDSQNRQTLTGCVATAASQIMRYWKYPASGQGSVSYTWNNGAANVTLSRDFSGSTYDWTNMADSVTSASSVTQQNAVAMLCADVGIAFQMDYGYSSSSANTSDAPSVFMNYFKYKNTISWVKRTDYTSASAWMQVFKNEVEAGRPSQLRINDPDPVNGGGHSVVVDGYRDSPAEEVHINMGWSGSYDGWYTPDSFITGTSSWTDTAYQGAAIGIQPNDNSIIISASAGTGGSISPSGSVSVSYGGSQAFTITPDTGYTVADVRVDGTSVGAVTTYTFSNITSTHTIYATFSSSGTQCTPDIKANGQSTSITIPADTPISITVSLAPGDQMGKNADWWVLFFRAPNSWYSMTTGGWVTGISPLFQWPLVTIPSVPIVQGYLPAGDYMFYFAVDTTPNGILDTPLYYQGVQVHVNRSPIKVYQ